MDEKQQAHIVLIGFMGTGKSTISQLLAERLGCTAVDIDSEIERLAGQTIAEIFSTLGEAGFRHLESKALVSTLSMPERRIIATGGGAVLDPQNCKLMQTHGHVIALKADAEQIIARVSLDSTRPLLHGNINDRVFKLLEERQNAYDFAHLTIDTTYLNKSEVVDHICNHFHI